MTHIVSDSDSEYNNERLVKSIKKTAIANRTPIGQAEDFARYISAKIEKWMGDKTEITASELRLQTAAVMAEYDSDTAYLYKNENKIF